MPLTIQEFTNVISDVMEVPNTSGRQVYERLRQSGDLPKGERSGPPEFTMGQVVTLSLALCLDSTLSVIAADLHELRSLPSAGSYKVKDLTFGDAVTLHYGAIARRIVDNPLNARAEQAAYIGSVITVDYVRFEASITGVAGQPDMLFGADDEVSLERGLSTSPGLTARRVVQIGGEAIAEMVFRLRVSSI